MPHLSLGVLGSVHIMLNGQRVTGFVYTKALALLAYLAVEADRAHRRETLAELLWPDQPEQAGRDTLRQVLAKLRHTLNDQLAERPFLLVTRHTLQFNRASDYDLDMERFVALLTACETHPHRQMETCVPCVQRLQQAVDLYRGDFLDSNRNQFPLPDSVAFHEWVTLRQEDLRQRALRALANLAAYHEQRGEYAQVCRAAERQIELEPWHENAHRQLMRALFFEGQRSAALEQYKQCSRILAEELQIEPEAETTTLYQQIRKGALSIVQVEARDVRLGHRHNALTQHNLPLQPTPFIGRKRELQEIEALFSSGSCRLLTLVGPPGIGKTRLALQAAAQCLDYFPDGVAFIPLAPVTSGDIMILAIADALRLSLRGREAPKVQLLTYLREKETLLVLDNLEHLIDEAGLLIELLASAPRVNILVTSHERLHLQWEWLRDVHGLDVPDSEQHQNMADYDAIALFLQCAQRISGYFSLVAAQADVVRICRLVAGMPLGIELAAAWVRVLPCSEIASGIEHSLDLLSTDLQNIPARHRSMRAAFDYSWRLLSEEERRIFSKLSVFIGGFDSEAAAQGMDVSLSLLAALVDKALLHRTVTGRYRIHEYLRQYAYEQLKEAGELEVAHSCHVRYFLALSD
jgi:predicted ATPase/DNA-binding SARP family transcriptional activator